MITLRPKGVTWLCSLSIIAALIDLTTAQITLWEPSDPQAAAWVASHHTEARVQLLLTYILASLTLLTCYFMLSAKNWARWLYLVINGAQYSLAFILLAVDDRTQDFLFLRFRGSMVPGVSLFALALYVLFTREAREYFSDGGRPWWMIEEELERKAAERK